MFATLTYDRLMTFNSEQRKQYIRWIDEELTSEEVIKNFIDYRYLFLNLLFSSLYAINVDASIISS